MGTDAKPLSALRQEAGLSQRQLAEALGLTPGAIAMYETGKRIPRYPTLLRLASYLSQQLNRHVQIEDIIFGPVAHEMRAKQEGETQR